MWCDGKNSNFYSELKVTEWFWAEKGENLSFKTITPAGVCEEEPIGGKVRNGDQAKMMEDQGGSSRGNNLLVD